MPLNSLNVHFLPSLVAADELVESCAIVIDVLRATTSMVQALAQGATRIHSCLTIEDAHELAERSRGDCLLAGERGGRRIDGFDLGNSPCEFSADAVANREIIFTTTNGTAALEHCRSALAVQLAAFSNLSSVVHAVMMFERIDIVCAGTDGAITREDVLLAGAIVTSVTARAITFGSNDSAILAADAWNGLSRWNAEVLAHTQGGRNLTAIGMERDLEFAARRDTCQIVPTRLPDGAIGVGDAGH